MRKRMLTICSLFLLIPSLESGAQSFNTKYLKDGMYFFDDVEKIKRSEIFTAFKSEFGLGANDEMRLQHEQVIQDGKFRASYRQYHKGILVETGQMNIAGDKGVTYMANGSILTGLDIDTSYTVPEDSALKTALTFYGASVYPWDDSEGIANYRENLDDPTAILHPPKGQMIIVKLRAADLSNTPGNYRRCWHYTMNFNASLAPKDIYVDAATNTVYTFQNSFREYTTTIGTLWTHYDGWYNNLVTRKPDIGFNFQLVDEIFKTETYKQKMSSSGTALFDLWKDNNNDWVESSSKTAASAHWAVARAQNYFNFMHGHAGMNTNWGFTRVHTDVPESHLSEGNAGYAYDMTNDRDVIGLAPDIAGNSVACLDVIAHEYAHGVIRHTSNLGLNVYDWDASSLNEAFADIFGHRVESFTKGYSDWNMGDNLGYSYKRSLADPYSDVSNQHPASGKSSDFYLHPITWQTIGNFGRYSNGGVMRKWHFMMCQGGLIYHPVSYETTFYPVGLGIEKASQIAYVGMRWWFWHNITYPEAAQQLVNHTIEDYGRCSQEHKLTSRILKSLGFTNLSNFICMGSIDITGNRTISLSTGVPAGVFKVRQNNDEADDAGQVVPGTYLWTLPVGWGGTQSGDSLVVNSFTNYDSKKLYCTFTSSDSLLVMRDSIVVHFSEEPWTVTDTNTHTQYRITDEKAIADQKSAISVYPNPAQDLLNVTLPNSNPAAMMTITELSGKVVMKMPLNEIQNSINIGSIPVGNYIINIEHNSNKTTEKLTITR